MPRFLRFAPALLILAACGGPPDPVVAPADKPVAQREEPAAPVPAGRDLARERAAFMEMLAASAEPADREALRQHLYDPDREVADRAFDLLAGMNDPPTTIERFVKRRPPLEEGVESFGEQARLFLESLTDPDLREAAVSHALARAVGGPLKAFPFPEGRTPRPYELKDSPWHRGGGVVSEDGLALEPPEKESGMVTVGGALPREREDIWEVHPEAPLPGAWSVHVPRRAAAAAGGFWLGCALAARREGDPLLVHGGSRPVPREGGLAFETRDGRTAIVRRRGGEVAWELPADCRLLELRADGPAHFVVAGEWSLGGSVFARVRLEDGRAEWAVPLGKDMRLAADDGELFWFVNGESAVAAVERETGALRASFVWAGHQFHSPATRLTFDAPTGRFLVDASAGTITSIPRATLLEQSRTAARPAAIASFADVFTLDLVVRDLPLRFGDTAAPRDEQEPPLDGPAEDHSLWNFFVGRFEEEKFSGLKTDGWEERWDAYAAGLVARAGALGMNAKSLGECLAVVRPAKGSEKAYAPVNVYRVRWNGEAAWIVVLKWEMCMKDRALSLAHICVHAFSVKTRKKLAYVTCG
ncbi:MAG: hypothetical protein HYY18_07370 [Planctomycetes bacterium]|nr:hypothetical protein [Planctomycetota bacterium]